MRMAPHTIPSAPPGTPGCTRATVANVTLKTLANRVFQLDTHVHIPISYDWNNNEPEYYPFKEPLKIWDYSRLNPAFFRNIEKRSGNWIRWGFRPT